MAREGGVWGVWGNEPISPQLHLPPTARQAGGGGSNSTDDSPDGDSDDGSDGDEESEEDVPIVVKGQEWTHVNDVTIRPQDASRVRASLATGDRNTPDMSIKEFFLLMMPKLNEIIDHTNAKVRCEASGRCGLGRQMTGQSRGQEE